MTKESIRSHIYYYTAHFFFGELMYSFKYAPLLSICKVYSLN